MSGGGNNLGQTPCSAVPSTLGAIISKDEHRGVHEIVRISIISRISNRL